MCVGVRETRVFTILLFLHHFFLFTGSPMLHFTIYMFSHRAGFTVLVPEVAVIFDSKLFACCFGTVFIKSFRPEWCISTIYHA